MTIALHLGPSPAHSRLAAVHTSTGEACWRCSLVSHPLHSRLAPAQVELGREALTGKNLAKYDELCSKYWVPGWQIIRPSGNAIEYEGYKKIIVEEGVKILSTELISINSTKVFAPQSLTLRAG